MADQRRDDIQQGKPIEASLRAGRITPAEAETIKAFFASPSSDRWPATGLQQRMQSSGG